MTHANHVVPPEVIRGIIARKPTQAELGVWISDSIEQWLRICSGVHELRRDEEEERSRHTRTAELLKVRRQSIQKECLHLATTYHPDPSGNNDSSTECCMCGAEV